MEGIAANPMNLGISPRSRLIALPTVGILLIGLASCGQIDQAVSDLQTAIDQLAALPSNAFAILNTAKEDLYALSGAVIKKAADAVAAVEANGVGLVGAELQCQWDSIGWHARDALIWIQQVILLGRSSPQPTPWVCLTNPTSVELAQNSLNGPYATLPNENTIDIFGFNFRPETLPVLRYYGSGGTFYVGDIPVAFHTAYQLVVNLQTVDFSNAQKGDIALLDWGNGVTPVNQFNMILDPYQAPPPPPTREDPFTVAAIALPGLLGGQCFNINAAPAATHDFTSSGWKLDVTKGDPGHPGIHDLFSGDNAQANASLAAHRDYNYLELTPYIVQIRGTLCGGAGIGASPAVFFHQYVVYETK